jgi:hypothetical protein
VPADYDEDDEDDYEGIFGSLALDSVIYRFEKGRVRHYELEVECSGFEEEEDIVFFLDDLTATYGESNLIPWWYGKLATGIAAEHILNNPSSNDLIVGERITPRGYDEILRLIKLERLSD